MPFIVGVSPSVVVNISGFFGLIVGSVNFLFGFVVVAILGGFLDISVVSLSFLMALGTAVWGAGHVVWAGGTQD